MRFLLFCLFLAAALPAPAADMEESWTFIDETAAAESPLGRQARAAIYRGDLLVALRCHDDGSRRWESFLVGATWFLQPKAHPIFELSVDAGPPVALEFQRETSFRFALINPPRELIQALGAGSQLTIGGPDFDGGPRTIPLKGSKEAIDGAFALCGYDPLAS
ncbi:MAG TPA: hypothetical protein VJL84_02925 [Kiloniellales bacterium]|nr:hypothetical protein [Kiloniellales bacterium]